MLGGYLLIQNIIDTGIEEIMQCVKMCVTTYWTYTHDNLDGVYQRSILLFGSYV